ncbi:MAG: P-loop NTPase fold protein, partial [Candidatus Heimdallarchaeaceae archaeon]
ELEPYVESNVRKEINNLKEKIAHRQKITNIKTTRTTTALGKWLSIALFLVPIGLGLLSSVDYIKSYLVFIGGLILSGAPLLIVVGNIIRILKDKGWRDIFNSKNWAFLEEEADENITQEVSEEDERSSIEFERYFDQIMEIVFKNSKIKKLILVVDNLDRIDVNDALKIWSTLQTFLSQRTQTWNKKEWFDRIWIIVPYDAEGLSRLWNRSTDGTNQNLSKPFFDKCFQLRIEVPKPIFSGWETFAKRMMDDALEGWTQSDKDELIRVLRITRKDLTDIPTPREIKNYVNQAGFLASQWGDVMSISSIAYYVCWRELANKSVEEIKSKLVKNELIDSRHKILLHENCIKELAGLVFGVTPEKGVQLLLEPEISMALKNGDGESLKKLCENHNDGFWHIFNYYIEHHDMDLNLALTSAKAVYDSVWKDSSEKCDEFVNKVSQIDVSAAQKEIEWSEQEIDKYICLIKIFHREKTFILSVYQHLIDCLRSSINKDKVEWKKIIRSLSKVVNTLSEIKIPVPQETIEELSLSNLISLAKTSSALGYETYKWIAPPEDIVKEISEAIVPGQTLQNGLTEAVQYSIDAGVKNGWDAVLTQCQQYINWNDGNYSNQSDEIFRIINVIIFKLRSVNTINQIASNIMNSGQYHNLLWHRRTQNLIYAALLCGYVFKEKLQKTTIPPIGNSINGLNEIKNFWTNSNPENAKHVLEEIKRYDLWSLPWELATDETNRLVKDIIAIAFDDKDAVELFHVKDGLAKLKSFSNLLEDTGDQDENVLKLIEKFTEYAELENEIIAAGDIDLVKYAYELSLIIKQTENQQVITKIANELRNINKETWIESLREDTYLTSLAIEAKKKRDEFFLENNFTDALIEFVKSQSDYTDWQKEHWHELISLMGESFQEYYKDK